MMVINHELVRQGKVIAVGVDLFRVKRIDNDFLSHMSYDFPAG